MNSSSAATGEAIILFHLFIFTNGRGHLPHPTHPGEINACPKSRPP